MLGAAVPSGPFGAGDAPGDATPKGAVGFKGLLLLPALQRVKGLLIWFVPTLLARCSMRLAVFGA